VTDYLLDTNHLAYWYDQNRREHEKVVGRIQALRQGGPAGEYVPRLFISVVTVGEIEYGHRVTNTGNPAEQAQYSAFVREQCPQPLDITDHVARQYGEFRAWLFNTYRDRKKRTKARRPEELVDPATARELGIQENDIWIAAQAITYNLVLVTHDTRPHFKSLLQHFSGGLTVEDWAE